MQNSSKIKARSKKKITKCLQSLAFQGLAKGHQDSLKKKQRKKERREKEKPQNTVQPPQSKFFEA